MMKSLIKSAFCLGLAVLASLTAVSCDNTVPEPETTEEITTEAPETESEKWDGNLTLVENAASEFTLVRGENVEDSEVQVAVRLRNTFNETFSMKMEMGTDWYKKGEEDTVADKLEIIVGNADRDEAKQLLEEIGTYGYGMSVTERKLVIVGTDSAYLAAAVQKFIDEIMTNGEKNKDGKLTVSVDDAYIQKVDKPTQLSDLIASGTKFTVKLRLAVSATAIGEYCVGQGAASDGTYAYFVLRTVEDGDAKIAKYELASGKFVAASEPVHVFHGNDMTYCKSTNQLVLVHGSSEGKILTLMDADTLTVTKQSQSIPNYGAGALTYSVGRDMFAGSQGGSTLWFMTTDFVQKKNFTRNPTSGYTAQGMGSDEKYIYFPMSGSTDNILMTYDWNGKYITDVHLPTKQESESMFWVNDTYYVNFYKSRAGAQLYKLVLIPEY